MDFANNYTAITIKIAARKMKKNKMNNNKPIRTDRGFSVSMVVIATLAILAIGLTATTVRNQAHASIIGNSGSGRSRVQRQTKQR